MQKSIGILEVFGIWTAEIVFWALLDHNATQAFLVYLSWNQVIIRAFLSNLRTVEINMGEFC